MFLQHFSLLSPVSLYAKWTKRFPRIYRHFLQYLSTSELHFWRSTCSFSLKTPLKTQKTCYCFSFLRFYYRLPSCWWYILLYGSRQGEVLSGEAAQVWYAVRVGRHYQRAHPWSGYRHRQAGKYVGYQPQKSPGDKGLAEVIFRPDQPRKKIIKSKEK